MTVKTILSAKGGDVISIEPTATLETAIKTLAKHRIGALLVLGPDRRVIGILSERDIVRVLGEQGADVLAQPLAQVMTRNVVICGQTETVGTIMERMTTGKFRHVPVVEQDQVVGIISIGDVVKHRLREMEQEFRGIARLYPNSVKDDRAGPARHRACIEQVRAHVSERRACAALGQHRSTQRKVPRGRDDEQRLTADNYRACPAIRPLWLSQGRRVPAPGGLDHQRQAGRAYLAT